ncbi:uncharacterized protein LOC124418777 isoform X2 [Lucilia cuprina]|uniref:uncharacterized protein LOC124418777 isoform X2 n=1 Tax=Lucilia cuprina TaxID=7375 RepID=UPI001F0531AE|nr:uncharacterized protein LOC124418777 isoform X2 [Lucilia cuprina]
MDCLEDSQRVRTNPTKKWNLEEEKSLIEFLIANREIEKPTAQAYYKRFSVETKVEVDWKLIRSKVRNMRTSYNKAKGWEGSTGAGSMDGETMKASLIKMCTFFYELDDIFGSRIVDNAVIDDSLSSDNFDCTDACIEESLHKEIENVASTSKKGIYSRTALSDILQMQTEMLNFKKERAEKELTLKEKEFSLKEREIGLREKEIESNELIKVKELEMKERLAMEELKLKYKQ